MATQREFEQTYKVLNLMADDILGTSTATPATQSAPTLSPEESNRELAAKREAAFQAYRKEHGGLGVGEVAAIGKVDRSDLLKYRKAKLYPVHSSKNKRLDRLFFGDSEAA